MLAALGFAIYYFIPEDENRNLTVPPELSISLNDESENKTSVFSLEIDSRLMDVYANANKFKIQPIKGVDDGPRECSERKSGERNCYTTKYQYTITSGLPTVTPGIDKTVNISVPVYVSGRGSQIGRAEDKSISDIRYFQSKLVANANIAVSIDSKWCTRVRITPDFLWQDATRVEVFYRAKVDLQYLVEKKLRDPITRIGKIATQTFLDCDSLRNSLSTAWNNSGFPINTPDPGIQQYVHITPVGLGYVGLKLVSNKLFMEYRISSSTTISNSPPEVAFHELPQARMSADEQNTAYIPLPIDLSYGDILSAVHNQIGSEPFYTRNRWGTHVIKITKMNIYPSGNNLVIGIRVHMTNSENLKDKYGWVYILTQPALMNTGEGILLAEPKFAEASDHDEWKEIRRALKETILETIEERGLLIQFSDATTDLLNTMKGELQNIDDNAPLVFTDPAFEINNVSLLENGLKVNGALGAVASFTSQASMEQIAKADIPGSNQEDQPLDPFVEQIHNRMDSLLNQIDRIEKRLKQFETILKN